MWKCTQGLFFITYTLQPQSPCFFHFSITFSISNNIQDWCLVIGLRFYQREGSWTLLRLICSPSLFAKCHRIPSSIFCAYSLKCWGCTKFCALPCWHHVRQWKFHHVQLPFSPLFWPSSAEFFTRLTHCPRHSSSHVQQNFCYIYLLFFLTSILFKWKFHYIELFFSPAFGLHLTSNSAVCQRSACVATNISHLRYLRSVRGPLLSPLPKLFPHLTHCKTKKFLFCILPLRIMHSELQHLSYYREAWKAPAL